MSFLSVSRGSSAPGGVTAATKWLGSFSVRAAFMVLPVLLPFLLSGCGPIRNGLREANEGLVAALPIDKNLYGIEALKTANQSVADRNAFIGMIAIDSASKCAIFVNGIASTNKS
ncbi:MAG: hypothetical protein J0L84_12555, partial [Verrucomicrobia bacterium]|nr:hypothetical protein [Verrucomicrobiota bacterium]